MARVFFISSLCTLGLTALVAHASTGAVDTVIERGGDGSLWTAMAAASRPEPAAAKETPGWPIRFADEVPVPPAKLNGIAWRPARTRIDTPGNELLSSHDHGRLGGGSVAADLHAMPASHAIEPRWSLTSIHRSPAELRAARGRQSDP